MHFVELHGNNVLYPSTIICKQLMCLQVIQETTELVYLDEHYIQSCYYEQYSLLQLSTDIIIT